MITVYRLFQMIMGIILSAFILYILISYAGSYAGVGKDAERLKTLDVFLQDADNVYFSGNPINFSRFSRDDYTSCHPRPTTPPKLWCFINERSYESEQLLIPLLMKPGNEVLITRNSIDLGWTRLDYIEALTGTRIIISPLAEDDASWGLLKDLVLALPDTSGHYPKLTFGFCDGSEIIEDTHGERWERDYFSRILAQPRGGLSFSPCTSNLSYDQVLVTLSPACSPGHPGPGICVSPPQEGVGYAYIPGSPKAYVYKDPVDLAALIIGGEKRTVFGDFVGEETWEFKNQLSLDSISLAARFMERRCGFVMQHHPPGQEDCANTYLELQGSMASLKELAQGDPYDISAMSSLKTELDRSRELWTTLLNKGCESHVSG
jgi:hypothetical protein